MPNDPRVKFKKKIHDPSHNIIYFGGGGSGGRSRSLFEEGNLPRPPPGGGDPPTQIDIPTYRAIESIPQPLKPGLNPGEITGITIGSFAAAAAAAELTRRAIEEQRRRRGGEQLVSQDERGKQLSSRQKGAATFKRQRAAQGISRALNNINQSLANAVEMTPVYSRIPIQAEMVLPSGATTPIDSGAGVGITTRATYTSRDVAPDRLVSVFPDRTGAVGVAPPSAPAPAPIRKPNVALDLQKELEMRQIEIQNPNISEARTKTLQSKIRVLEREINSRGIGGDASETSRRILNMALEDRAAIESAGGVGIGSGTRAETELSRQGLVDRLDAIRQTQFDRAEQAAQDYLDLANRLNERQAERNRNYNEGLIELTPDQRARLESTSLFDINDPNSIADMTDAQFREFVSNEGINIGGPSSGNVTPEMTKIDILEGQIDTIDLKLMDRQMPIERRAALIAEQTNLKNTLATEQKAFHDANIRRAAEKINIPQEIPASSDRRRISKTITSETPIANNPINDKIIAAQPIREVEMQTLGAHGQRLQTAVDTMVEVKTRGPSTMETMRTEIQKATSRKPIEAKVKIDPIPKPPKQPTQTAATKAALERARAASGLSTDVEMRPVVQAPPISEADALQRALKQSALEAGAPYESGKGASSSKGVTAETLPAEQPTVPRTGKGKGKALAPLEPIERPTPTEVPKLPPPPPATARPVATETLVDRYNKIFNRMIEEHTRQGFEIPTAPAGMTEIESKKYIMDEIIKQTDKAGRQITEFPDTPQERVFTLEESLTKVQSLYDRTINDPTTQRPIEAIAPEESISIAPTKKGKGKGKLTKKTGFLATEEQRLRPTALAGEAQARVRAAAPAEVRAPTAQERATAPVETARAPIAETATARAAAASELRAPTAPAPETLSARRQLSAAPELTAGRPIAPGERASVTEKINFFEQKPVAPPTETPAPSAPPSAPETEISTPREGAIMERTPAERAAFAEEVRLGIGKKVPGRQKAKFNFGKPNTTIRNPLDIFVSPQHRNIPNFELHPGAKNLNKALSELGSRVPKLVPTKAKLISMGTNLAAEGGGMVAGFYAGSEAGKAMSNYFATHPPKNRGEEYGQALATSMVALGVGNLVAKAVTYAIRQGASYALAGQISGSISSAGAAGATALLEAAAFATIATTTQFYTTKALEDAGYSHADARSTGALAATGALMTAELAAWAAKGGVFNPAADLSLIASELFIIGFGIWSYFEERKAGEEQDKWEAENRDELARQRQERQDSIARINRTNNLRQNFMLSLEEYDYDFDALYATLSNEEREAMGIATPEGKADFQRQVESAFDPFGAFQAPNNGLQAPVVLSKVEADRRDVFNEYINWYINELRGIDQPSFNMNDPRVIELNEYSGGTWQSAAGVTATTNYAQSERTHPLIENAQNEIINAFHNDRRTIEEMPPEVVRYAELDPNFRNSYEAYIVTEAQAQILIEFNRTQYTYNDVDPKLLEIADRDPNFRAAADAYYQTLANQARDLNLSISEVARLNSLMERDQAIEIGKLNEARNLIIQKNQAENQAIIDAYNANILREINIYGDNFESIIRNINDQLLLTGHTFLYATTPAALYEQLHMEMPELELVDPDDEIPENVENATWKPGKGRKVGDTAIYSYRYNLTDEQNQELDELARREFFINDPEEMKRRAAIIYQRDRNLYEQTDQERADDLGMTLDAYYAKYGIPVDPTTLPIPDFDGTYPTTGRVRMPDGRIETYVNGKRTSVELPPEIPFDATLTQQPDGNIRMPDGSMRTYKDGKVTFVSYPSTTPAGDRLTPDQINSGTPSYSQLQTLYPEAYQSLLRKYAGDPDADSKIEAALARGHKEGYKEQTPNIPPTTPDREPTYEELKVMYPDRYQRIYEAYVKYGDPANADELTELVLRQAYEDNPVPLPASTTTPTEPTPTEPTRPELTYEQLQAMYFAEYQTLKQEQRENRKPGTSMEMMDANVEAALRQLYLQDPRQQPTQPTEPTGPLKNGNVKMPDGSTRTYINGLVVSVSYPSTLPPQQQKTPKQINDEEGTRPISYIGPTTTPETPKDSLKQGAVKMPDGSKRIYIDGKVVSVSYPDGVKGPTINEINAAEGVKQADAPSITNTNPMAAVDDLFKGKTQKPAPAPMALEEEVVLTNRLDSLMGNNTPAPTSTTETT